MASRWPKCGLGINKIGLILDSRKGVLQVCGMPAKHFLSASCCETLGLVMLKLSVFLAGCMDEPESSRGEQVA